MIMNTLFAIALLIPAAAIAASPFDGTWKTELDSVQFSLQTGRLRAQRRYLYVFVVCTTHFNQGRRHGSKGNRAQLL